MPLRLYHYTTWEGMKGILNSKSFRISLCKNTNDYTEGVPQGREERGNAGETSEYGYISLSKICNSPAMWDYYADKSRGVCLVFDFPSSFYEESLSDKINLCGSETRLLKIEYANEKVDSNKPYELLSRKSPNWEHEKEYRFIFQLEKTKLKDGDFYIDFPSEFLNGIIVGAACDHQCAEVQTLCYEKLKIQITATKAKGSPNTFDIIPSNQIPHHKQTPKIDRKKLREKLDTRRKPWTGPTRGI